MWNLNGFFMVFSRYVLEMNMMEQYYFDPSLPFGGNESEWFDRFKKIGGEGVVVPKSFVYHYKLKRWRDIELNNSCIYTVNTGGYEGGKINIASTRCYIDMEHLYFTDNFDVVYKCIKLDIIPFFVSTDGGDPKLIQRTIKAFPQGYLPRSYTHSLYIDGNISFKETSLKYIRQHLESLSDIVCFNHPSRTSVVAENKEILLDNLEHESNIDQIRNLYKISGFEDKIGLTETNVLFRNHYSTRDFCKEWAELISICKRDQSTFDFLLFKHGVAFTRLPYVDKLKFISWSAHVNPKNRQMTPSTYCKKV